MLYRYFVSAVLLLALALPAAAADLQNDQAFPLWADKAPAAQGDKPEDMPTLTAFLPAAGHATGAAVVVCPGGAYGFLAGHEGKPVAEWLASHGVTGFVLKYRLGPKYHHPVELGDAQRAIRYVRSHAAEWKLDPKRIGILGFSAGGHLASSAATHFDDGAADAADPIDRVSCRPDAQILIYPVVTMGQATHGGSKNNLLGANPDPKLVDLMSNEKQVTDQTPPAFVLHSINDRAVPVANSDNYVKALIDHNRPVNYLRGDFGDHGFGMKDFWTVPCLQWLKSLKFAGDEPAK